MYYAAHLPGQPYAQHRDDAFGIIGHTCPLRDIVDQVDKAAAARKGVLISGESGTGRGVVARAIHAGQGTRPSPFVAVYCGTLDPREAEERLFGKRSSRDAGASSSARCERIDAGSILHEAMGGTLAFRSVEELPARVQRRLARLLRDRECQIGSRNQAVPYDVQPVTAVEPGFDAMVTDGRVRSDLYKRFAEVQINLLPLRERRKDIPALAGFLLSRACQKVGIPDKTLDAAASSVLAAMPWRGNARELLVLIEMLAIKVVGDRIALNDLLEIVRLDGNTSTQWNVEATLRQARQRFEREYIAAVVAQHRGHVPEAARSLGIQRTNLYRKLRHLHIVPGHDRRSGGARAVNR
jgi:DNA-binding NtrC family response regulator